ncbi:MAG: hypothetical protein ABUM51_10365, partial [Bacteroidota bacterium]
WSDIPRIGAQFAIYMIGLFLAGCIYASTIFSPLSNKKEAIQYLSAPASQLEKFLCALLYAVIIFFLVYTLVFYAVDICMVKLALKKAATFRYREFYQPIGVLNIFSRSELNNDDIIPQVWLLVYAAFQSAFILGSIYFNRYAFIKTVVALLLAGICVLFVSKVVNESLPKGWHLRGLLEWGGADAKGEYLAIEPAGWIRSTIVFLVTYTIPIIFYYIAYIRLKEKEV